VRVVLDRFKRQTKQHHFWGAALLVIFLVSCGSNTPKEEQKPEEQKQSISPAPKPEAPVLKKAELGPQPDIGSEIILEVPGEGAQSFHLIGEPGTRYLARVTPLYSTSKKTKRKRVLSAAKQTQADKEGEQTTAQEPPKPPQGFAATFFPVAESPSRPGNFYTAETLKGIQEGRYELPAPTSAGTTTEEKTEKTDVKEATEAAQATETVPPTASPSDQNAPAPNTPPMPLPESLWSPVTNKGTEVFDVETEAVPSDQSAQPIVLEVKNLDAVPRTVKVVIRQRKP
jgi:hypothetical protein